MIPDISQVLASNPLAPWNSFSEFAADAFLGLLIFFVMLGAYVWWVNRK